MHRLINRHWKGTLVMAVICGALAPGISFAQAAPPVILQVDIENMVEYFGDTFDPLKLATVATPTTPTVSNFETLLLIADIVAVNGTPAKGTWVARAQQLTLRPMASHGVSVADVTRTGPGDETYEILRPDGTPVGSIVSLGFFGGPPPPGAPAALTTGNHAIVGGTGAFAGIRGEDGGGIALAAVRIASFGEDPANRRVNGGGKMRFTLHLIPLNRPAISAVSGSPAVVHSSDFTLVSSASPAKAGEILSLFCRGLGPTTPGVDPGSTFPQNPPAAVNAPVDVSVNGKSAEVLGAVGYPGSTDGYQVNFRVPADAALGMASLQVSSAWIASDGVSLAIH